MKKKVSLPIVLRTIFGAGQILMSVGGVIFVLVFLLSFMVKTRPIMFLPFTATFQPLSKVVSINSPSVGPKDISIHRLSADLTINLHSSDPKIATAARWTLLPQLILSFAAGYLICGRLKGLCARYAEGEVFSDANLNSIRFLGLILVGSSVANFGLHLGATYYLADYLSEHVTMTDIGPGISPVYWELEKLPVESLVTGLLMLLLAEAFRQGLALKKENDLTV